MLPLLIAGTALKIGSDIMAAKAETKAAKDKAKALEAQAQRRIQKGKQEGLGIKTQGQMDKTSMLAQGMSSNSFNRESIYDIQSLEEITNRAQLEADAAMEDAEYEASILRADASATMGNAKDRERASYIGAGGTILGTAYDYKTRTR